MRKSSGFTIIELVITLVIIGLVSIVGYFSYTVMTQNVKNENNENHAKNLASVLEEIYDSGFLPNGTKIDKAHYLSTVDLESNLSSNIANYHPGLENDLQIIKADSITVGHPLSNTDQNYLKANFDKVIYQPLDNDNQACTTAGQECVKFNIYYIVKQDGFYSVASQIIKSRYR